MLPRDGGHGGRVVVDPVELSACASRLTAAAGRVAEIASRVRGHTMPEMPPEIAGRVSAEVSEVGCSLGGASAPFVTGAKELKVRALWAEISAAGGTVSGLDSTQLRDFVEYMKDGSMLRYSTQGQRWLAGFLVGEIYKGQYKDPAKLIELARIMRENGQDGDFAGAFIEEFGAERFADIPRVIQAMEWGDRLTGLGFSSSSDPFVDTELAMKLGLDGYRYDGDPVELLSSFSLALASATSAGQLTRTTERALAYDEDSWAVAQLLHTGRFGAEFLRDVFHSGVIAEIGRRSVTSASGGIDTTGYAPIGGTRGDGIETDQVELILDALERNDEAVALALADPVPEQFQIGLYLQGRDDPLEILYDQNRHWDDDGERLARMYDAGLAYAHSEGDLERAYRMTESLVDRTLHSDESHDVVTESLARDLAAHHMENLHLSASVSMPAGPGPLEVSGETAYRLIFGKEDMTDLMREFSDHEEANETFLGGARDYQARLILENTQQLGGDYDWAERIGGFNGLLMNASDLENVEDFDADNARHKALFSFVNSVTGAVQSLHPAGAAAGIVTGPVLSALGDATGPSVEDLVNANGDAKELITNQMHAAIVVGYHENGHLQGSTAPPGTILSDKGHLIDLRSTDMTDAQIRQFLLWMDQDTGAVTREAFEAADQARDNRDLDTN